MPVTEAEDKKEINRDSLEKVTNQEKYDRFPEVKYHRVVLRNKKHRDSLLYAFREDKKNPLKNQVFCTINRKARHYMRVGDTVLVPDTILPEKIAYSIFPQYYHEAKAIPKIIIMSNAYQAYAAYEYGVQVHFAAVNSGKEKTPTFPGRYYLNWKSELRISSLDSTWKMPFTWNIHRYAGSAFHQFTMPGYPASHSCARQFKEDAEWLYKWGEGSDYVDGKPIDTSGTPVLIIDNYDYSRGKRGPWLYLSSNKALSIDLPEKPLEFELPYIPITQIPEDARGSLPDKKRYLYAEDTLRARGWVRENVKLTESVNFNKLRRQKKLAEARKKAAGDSSNKKNVIKNTDLDEIKKKLEFLENEEVKIINNEPPE
jgi:hypothetical protein